MDGVPYEYKKGSLSAGKGRPGNDGYYISCHQREGLIVKQGEFKGIDIVLYPKDTNKVATSVNNIKALITKNKGVAIGDIYTGDSRFDSVPYKLNGQKVAPKIISWQQYGKALAGEVELMFSTTNGDDYYSYKTMNGDEFQMELISATPIVVKGNAMVNSQGYMAKFRIPSLVLRRFYYGHYTPLYTEEYKELKDVEFYIVLR
jgi:signal peptidase I